jgi:hypothetical protein
MRSRCYHTCSVENVARAPSPAGPVCLPKGPAAGAAALLGKAFSSCLVGRRPMGHSG